MPRLGLAQDDLARIRGGDAHIAGIARSHRTMFNGVFLNFLMFAPLPISQDSGAGFLPPTQTPDDQVGKLGGFAFQVQPLISR